MIGNLAIVAVLAVMAGVLLWVIPKVFAPGTDDGLGCFLMIMLIVLAVLIGLAVGPLLSRGGLS